MEIYNTNMHLSHRLRVDKLMGSTCYSKVTEPMASVLAAPLECLVPDGPE
jgi:hypothetical protein